MDIEQTVLDVLESVIAMTRTHTDRASEETFTECLVCGDVDSHTDECPVPAIQRFLEGPTEPKTPSLALDTRDAQTIIHGPFSVGQSGMVVFPVQKDGVDTEYTVLVACRPNPAGCDITTLKSIGGWVATLPPRYGRPPKPSVIMV